MAPQVTPETVTKATQVAVDAALPEGWFCLTTDVDQLDPSAGCIMHIGSTVECPLDIVFSLGVPRLGAIQVEQEDEELGTAADVQEAVQMVRKALAEVVRPVLQELKTGMTRLAA